MASRRKRRRGLIGASEWQRQGSCTNTDDATSTTSGIAAGCASGMADVLCREIPETPHSGGLDVRGTEARAFGNVARVDARWRRFHPRRWREPVSPVLSVRFWPRGGESLPVALANLDVIVLCLTTITLDRIPRLRRCAAPLGMTTQTTLTLPSSTSRPVHPTPTRLSLSATTCSRVIRSA